LELRLRSFALELRLRSFSPLHRISDARSLSAWRAWALNLWLCALLWLYLANLLSLIIPLLLFQLTHFATRFFIPTRGLARHPIYLLLTAGIYLRHAHVSLTPDFELLVLGFFSNALDTQPTLLYSPDDPLSRAATFSPRTVGVSATWHY
jgi:hypothetical protein